MKSDILLYVQLYILSWVIILVPFFFARSFPPFKQKKETRNFRLSCDCVDNQYYAPGYTSSINDGKSERYTRLNAHRGSERPDILSAAKLVYRYSKCKNLLVATSPEDYFKFAQSAIECRILALETERALLAAISTNDTETQKLETLFQLLLLPKHQKNNSDDETKIQVETLYGAIEKFPGSAKFGNHVNGTIEHSIGEKRALLDLEEFKVAMKALVDRIGCTMDELTHIIIIECVLSNSIDRISNAIGIQNHASINQSCEEGSNKEIQPSSCICDSDEALKYGKGTKTSNSYEVEQTEKNGCGCATPLPSNDEENRFEETKHSSASSGREENSFHKDQQVDATGVTDKRYEKKQNEKEQDSSFLEKYERRSENEIEIKSTFVENAKRSNENNGIDSSFFEKQGTHNENYEDSSSSSPNEDWRINEERKDSDVSLEANLEDGENYSSLRINKEVNEADLSSEIFDKGETGANLEEVEDDRSLRMNEEVDEAGSSAEIENEETDANLEEVEEDSTSRMNKEVHEADSSLEINNKETEANLEEVEDDSTLRMNKEVNEADSFSEIYNEETETNLDQVEDDSTLRMEDEVNEADLSSEIDNEKIGINLSLEIKHRKNTDDDSINNNEEEHINLEIVDDSEHETHDNLKEVDSFSDEIVYKEDGEATLSHAGTEKQNDIKEDDDTSLHFEKSDGTTSSRSIDVAPSPTRDGNKTKGNVDVASFFENNEDVNVEKNDDSSLILDDRPFIENKEKNDNDLSLFQEEKDANYEKIVYASTIKDHKKSRSEENHAIPSFSVDRMETEDEDESSHEPTSPLAEIESQNNISMVSEIKEETSNDEFGDFEDAASIVEKEIEASNAEFQGTSFFSGDGAIFFRRFASLFINPKESNNNWYIGAPSIAETVEEIKGEDQNSGSFHSSLFTENNKESSHKENEILEDDNEKEANEDLSTFSKYRIGLEGDKNRDVTVMSEKSNFDNRYSFSFSDENSEVDFKILSSLLDQKDCEYGSDSNFADINMEVYYKDTEYNEPLIIGDGEIDLEEINYEEFLTDERMVNLFGSFDMDNDEIISFKEIVLGMYKITKDNDRTSETAIHAIFLFHGNHVFALNYNEFTKFIVTVLAASSDVAKFDDLANVMIRQARIPLTITPDDVWNTFALDSIFLVLNTLEEGIKTHVGAGITQLNSNELAKVNCLFNMWDLDNNFFIDFHELALGLRKLQTLTKLYDTITQSIHVLGVFDVNDDRKLEHKEFMLFIESFEYMRKESSLGQMINFMLIANCLNENSKAEMAYIKSIKASEIDYWL